MKTIDLPTDKSQIEMWTIRSTSMALLGQDLVPSDSHDEEGAMMTENQGFYFVPCDDDFVMSHPTILSPSKPTDKPRWRVEVVQVENNYPHEPDDYDLVEVGERSDALIRAIEQASIYEAQMNIQNIGEGIFWAAENLKEKLGYYEY
jgi:hypothetical protein